MDKDVKNRSETGDIEEDQTLLNEADTGDEDLDEDDLDDEVEEE